jgi:hypothetical protein
VVTTALPRLAARMVIGADEVPLRVAVKPA